jgi:hypothetical protein
MNHGLDLGVPRTLRVALARVPDLHDAPDEEDAGIGRGRSAWAVHRTAHAQYWPDEHRQRPQRALYAPQPPISSPIDEAKVPHRDVHYPRRHRPQRHQHRRLALAEADIREEGLPLLNVGGEGGEDRLIVVRRLFLCASGVSGTAYEREWGTYSAE